VNILLYYLGIPYNAAFWAMTYGLAALLFFLCLAHQSFIRLPLYLLFYGIFSVYTIASGLSTGVLSFSAKSLITILRDQFVYSFFSMLIIENVSISKSTIRVIMYGLLGMLVFGLIVSLIQFLVNSAFLNAPNQFTGDYQYEDLSVMSVEYRIRSIYAWGRYFDLVTSVPIILAVLLAYFAQKPFLQLPAVVSSIVVILLNTTRISIATFIIAMYTTVTRQRNRLKRIWNFLLVVVLVSLLLLIIASLVSPDFLMIYSKRLFSRTYESRFLAVRLFLAFFKENWLWGTGGQAGNDLIRSLAGETASIHNGWLTILYLYGVIGGVFYLLFISFIIRDLYRVSKRSCNWSLFIGMFSFLVTNLTMNTITFNYMGTALLIILKVHYTQNDITNRIPSPEIIDNELAPPSCRNGQLTNRS
jgi:hypothetical protein